MSSVASNPQFFKVFVVWVVMDRGNVSWQRCVGSLAESVPETVPTSVDGQVHFLQDVAEFPGVVDVNE